MKCWKVYTKLASNTHMIFVIVKTPIDWTSEIVSKEIVGESRIEFIGAIRELHTDRFNHLPDGWGDVPIITLYKSKLLRDKKIETILN